MITPDQMHRIDPQAQEPCCCAGSTLTRGDCDEPSNSLLVFAIVTLLASFVIGVSGLLELTKPTPAPAPAPKVVFSCPKVTT